MWFLGIFIYIQEYILSLFLLIKNVEWSEFLKFVINFKGFFNNMLILF